MSVDADADGDAGVDTAGDVEAAGDPDPDTVDRFARRVIQKRASAYNDLLDLEEPFRHADTDIDKSAWKKAVENRIVVPAGTTEETEYRHTPTVWKIPEHVKAYLRNVIDGRDRLPCGHTGIRNVRGGDYECTRCEQEYTRAEVERHLYLGVSN